MGATATRHVDASVSIYAVSRDLIAMRIGVTGAERSFGCRRALMLKPAPSGMG
jgi:hypothetical protein